MKCPKCSGEMESGLLLDRSHGTTGGAFPMVWAEAENDKLFGVEANKNAPGQYQVDSYRCASCGFIELYGGMGKE